MQMNIKKTHPEAIIPTRQKPGDSGLDLHALLPDGTAFIRPGERRKVRTGIAIELPLGYEGQVRPRSGLADKSGVQTCFGTIDNGYRGEVMVNLFNLSFEGMKISHGDRIAQLVVASVAYPEPIEVTEELPPTERGTGGFGSTGV
jgi:dUTP pyrophosphatase